MIFGAGIVKDANVFEIVRHPWFMSAFIAGALAQATKFMLEWVHTKKMDFACLKTSGGMPSAHSSLVSALATAVGLTEGFDAPYAMIAVGFGLLVLCDAATLRREAGRHAKLLNRLIEKFNDRVEASERIEVPRLKERIGHKRREVIAGMAVGISVAYVICGIWDFWK